MMLKELLRTIIKFDHPLYHYLACKDTYTKALTSQHGENIRNDRQKIKRITRRGNKKDIEYIKLNQMKNKLKKPVGEI